MGEAYNWVVSICLKILLTNTESSLTTSEHFQPTTPKIHAKMSRIAQLLVSLALMAVLAASVVTALKCKKCIPTEKKSCVDESEWEADDEPCTGADPYCRRMIQNVEGKISMVLQCGTAPSLDKEGKFKEYYNTANDYVKASIYHCKGDLCNSASDFGASKVAAVAVVAIAWMLH